MPYTLYPIRLICGHCEGQWIDILTKSVPRMVKEFASRMLLHEKHVFSLHSFPDSWELHIPSGG